MSSGKTLSMTAYAYRQFKEGNVIISNYHLQFPYEVLTKEKIEQYAKQELNLDNSTILIDEIYLYIDSRQSGAKRNKTYSYFALQTSKRNVNMFYSAQNFHSVDKRIRDNTHVIINCIPLVLIDGEYYEVKDQWNRGIPKSLWDSFYIKIVEMRRYSVGFEMKAQIDNYMLKASDYFNMYDTKEIIDINQ